MKMADRSTMRSWAQIMEAIDKMEGITGKKFGDKENPLTRFRSFRSKSFYAWYDGYNPEPWT